MELKYPALEGGFLITGPPGRPRGSVILDHECSLVPCHLSLSPSPKTSTPSWAILPFLSLLGEAMVTQWFLNWLSITDEYGELLFCDHCGAFSAGILPNHCTFMSVKSGQLLHGCISSYDSDVLVKLSSQGSMRSSPGGVNTKEYQRKEALWLFGV